MKKNKGDKIIAGLVCFVLVFCFGVIMVIMHDSVKDYLARENQISSEVTEDLPSEFREDDTATEGSDVEFSKEEIAEIEKEKQSLKQVETLDTGR